MYDKFRDAYTLYAQIEVDCANYVKANFEDLRDQASLVRHCMYTHRMVHIVYLLWLGIAYT